MMYENIHIYTYIYMYIHIYISNAPVIFHCNIERSIASKTALVQKLALSPNLSTTLSKLLIVFGLEEVPPCSGWDCRVQEGHGLSQDFGEVPSQLIHPNLGLPIQCFCKGGVEDFLKVYFHNLVCDPTSPTPHFF